jgi:glycosyltransferase involved in cell wall biosynthesis
LRIGIDISQIAHEGTGVANYTLNLVENLLKIDKKNEYILFYSSLRKKLHDSRFTIHDSRIRIKKFRLPPTILDILWNRLHIIPIEWFIGDVDVFISSDWVQPPTRKAKKVTVIHDLSFMHYPDEHHNKIVNVQKRRLKWVKEESDCIICDSKATRKDVIQILKVNKDKIKIIYPGI